MISHKAPKQAKNKRKCRNLGNFGQQKKKQEFLFKQENSHVWLEWSDYKLQKKMPYMRVTFTLCFNCLISAESEGDSSWDALYFKNIPKALKQILHTRTFIL